MDETRLGIVGPFLGGRLELGAGQSTEVFARDWTLGQLPYCAARSGPTGTSIAESTSRPSASGYRGVGGSISWIRSRHIAASCAATCFWFEPSNPPRSFGLLVDSTFCILSRQRNSGSPTEPSPRNGGGAID